MSVDRPVGSRGGRPLWALGGILVCWIAARAALFEMPFERPALMERPLTIVGLESSPQSRHASAEAARGGPTLTAEFSAPVAATSSPPVGYPTLVTSPPVPLPMRPSLEPGSPQRAAGHNLLWMAAMQAIPLLPEVAAALDGAPPATAPGLPRAMPGRSSSGRWSGDAWLSWRAGTRGLLASGPATPVYGASQAGAVLRYELAPGSGRRPAAYIRSVRALDVNEGDLAAGLAIRPLAYLPVTAHAEARLSRRGTSLSVRPAAMVSGGLDAAPIAGGFTARGYAQAGFVGGRDATPFADGSLVAEGPLWRAAETVLTAGAGTWGGVQRGSGRLDLGPSASLRFRLGDGAARISADYRLRVAGNAEPASGAALTLSAGF